MSRFKPLLAATHTGEVPLRFPLHASPKVDGIRCITFTDGSAVTRSLKPIPNDYIRASLKNHAYDMDGELVVGDPNHKDVFNRTTGPVRRQLGMPDFTYLVFDYILDTDRHYRHRFEELEREVRLINVPFIKLIGHRIVHNEDELMQYEAECVAMGYEGIMVRRLDAPYKFGRSTINEQVLVKIKRFEDQEARIVGFEPLMRNQNEAIINELGYQERSTHKANLIADDLLGKLIVCCDEFGEFSIGTGFNEKQRREIWKNRDLYVGAQITFKFQRVGTVDKPRLPVFKSFRDFE